MRKKYFCGFCLLVLVLSFCFFLAKTNNKGEEYFKSKEENQENIENYIKEITIKIKNLKYVNK